MFIPIPIHYKYKNYPYTPKATKRSRLLGTFTSVAACIVWSFLFFCIVGGILSSAGMEDDTAYIIGIILLIPFIVGIVMLKNGLSKKIDAAAMLEMQENPQNASRQGSDYRR